MNNFFLLMLSFFCLCEISVGQGKVAKLHLNEPNLCVDIEGKYILFHPYIISLDTSGYFYITFNDKALTNIGNNNFILIATNNGLLRVYSLNSNDTLLLTEKQLLFRLPEFSIFIGNKRSGSTIKLKDLMNAHVHVEIENTDVTYATISINSADLKYFKDKNISEVKLRKEVEEDSDDFQEPGLFIINQSIFSELSEESPNILIVSVVIKIEGRFIKLAPSVFFIEE